MCVTLLIVSSFLFNMSSLTVFMLSHHGKGEVLSSDMFSSSTHSYMCTLHVYFRDVMFLHARSVMEQCS